MNLVGAGGMYTGDVAELFGFHFFMMLVIVEVVSGWGRFLRWW